VTTHGQPFYAGWGLTEDCCPVPRRTRRRSLDELVAASLILYPVYLDPISGLPCGPELLVDRLANESRRTRNNKERLIRLAQISAARALHLGHTMKRFAGRA
jgi:capsular polysaccharide export protein